MPDSELETPSRSVPSSGARDLSYNPCYPYKNASPTVTR